MSRPDPVVFLLDVDNTLFDNDRLVVELKDHLTQVFGADCREHYWSIFEEHRAKVGYADYLAALQQYRAEDPGNPDFLRLSYFLLDYPFPDRVFPGAFDVIARFKSWGRPVILSDGDVVFQPRKIQRSGLFAAVEEHALIYIHKEQQLDDVERNYPAEHYVMVDDKLRLLHAVKQIWKTRVTTVFPRQGHYAHDPKLLAEFPAADVTVDRIQDLLQFDLPTLLAASGSAPA